MLFKKSSSQGNDLAAKVNAINRSQAVIEFKLDGTIVTANDNFLNALGYTLDEVQGKNHSMFVDSDFANGPEYKEFWQTLNRGEFVAKEFARIRKNGSTIWIQASYNPLLDNNGKPYGVIKFATDITTQKLNDAVFKGQLAAIGKSQAVIHFEMDGTVIDANENFLTTLGYSLDEIKGKHHNMFVEPDYAHSSDYKKFWDTLKQGKYISSEFKRIGKGGKEVWIQASYNPILDMNGKPFKVVKFATDVTEQKLHNADVSGQLDAIGKSQAVIEFNLDGTIRTANENFLTTLGYTLSEVQGKNHSMFVETEYAQSQEYTDFWAKLNQGEFFSDEFKRIGKGGKEVWIQASYNPILDLNGKPFKVVKYATDVTQQVIARQKSEHIREIMESVASASEELNVSVQEISSNMAKSQETTTMANNLVVKANDEIKKLADAAESMGGIIDIIDGVSDQTNLLALNATIEAARAGDAGKGFAVVANEVKQLAGQSKNATEQISSEIANMRSITDGVVSSLDKIQHETQKVLEYVSSTATAVEQQSGVTADMSSSMQRAAAEANKIGA